MKYIRKLTKSEGVRHFIYFRRKYKDYLPESGKNFVVIVNGEKINTVLDKENRMWFSSERFDRYEFKFGTVLEINVDVSKNIFEIQTITL